ncbi:MAG: DEAD/DEAH box helicase family protein [Acidiferrobacterales bacterium]|nr:DEAD/DEAH box helicase family protein [Acidiferrobacterales bacterium]
MSNRTATEWLRTIENHVEHAGDGLWLEELVCDLGDQILEWDLKEVFPWDEWPDRTRIFGSSSSVDVGIDIVGVKNDSSLVAIQCKARSSGRDLRVSDIAPFRMSAGDDKWSELWVVSNVQFSRGVREANLRSESKPLKLVDFVEPVRTLAYQEISGKKEDKELTNMQDEVVAKVLNGLKNHAKNGRSEWNCGEARGQIVMPCGTGKTRVAYRVMKEIVNSGELTIVLVPSIALVSQIKREFQILARQDHIEMRTLAICSDSTAGGFKNGRVKSEDKINLATDPTLDTSCVHSYEVVGDTATSEEQVVKWLQKQKEESANAIMTLFSTYQSAHNTAAGLLCLGIKAKLMICDEAHRTAGIKKIPKNGERLRNFTLCHDKDKFPAIYRLYQTATPRVFTNIKANQKADLLYVNDTTWDVRTMNDVATFGPELYRLSYVDAVKRNLLSDYRIIAWGIRESDEVHKIAKKLNENTILSDNDASHWDSNKAMRALTLAAFLAGCVKNVNVRSVIAFCNRIKLSSELAIAVESKPIREWLADYFQRVGIKQSPVKFNVQHIDASFPSAKRNDALHKLGAADLESPFCISNVGIFGEGTDSPGLSAVAFLNPRKSPVDVIQAVGRAMRKSPDKNLGYILVPVVIPKDHDPENFLRNSSPEQGWEELGQILQALRAHDGRIEDHLESLMEFYAPPPPVEYAKHIVVTKQPNHPFQVFELNTKTQTVEQVLAPKNENDKVSIANRLQRDSGKVREIKEVSELDPLHPPMSISAVIVDNNQDLHIKDLTYTTSQGSDNPFNERWDPVESIEKVKKFIRDDKRRKKTQARRINPRIKRKTYRQLELGEKILHLGGDKLAHAQTGIHLNLLERSGIQTGSKRDINLLRGTVRTVAEHLRSEDLEEILALRLGVENVERSTSGVADACVITAVIWVNAAIMHARLARHNSNKLSDIRPIEASVSDVTPARGLIESWQKILVHDYVPIFQVALELLHDVAFKNLECVSDALRQLAKDASEIADHYANLGMDHAGELFNEVMGNQRSDGAFFTRPLAATMLSELCLHASSETNWLDDDLWEKRRIFDPACGSGTILVAMMNAIKRRIALAGGGQIQSGVSIIEPLNA